MQGRHAIIGVYGATAGLLQAINPDTAVDDFPYRSVHTDPIIYDLQSAVAPGSNAEKGAAVICMDRHWGDLTRWGGLACRQHSGGCVHS